MASIGNSRSFDRGRLGVTPFAEQMRSNGSLGGDELRVVLDGEVEITALTDGGPARMVARAGSVRMMPRGRWHRQVARPAVRLLFATPWDGTEPSSAEDPTGSA